MCVLLDPERDCGEVFDGCEDPRYEDGCSHLCTCHDLEWVMGPKVSLTHTIFCYANVGDLCCGVMLALTQSDRALDACANR